MKAEGRKDDAKTLCTLKQMSSAKINCRNQLPSIGVNRLDTA